MFRPIVILFESVFPKTDHCTMFPSWSTIWSKNKKANYTTNQKLIQHKNAIKQRFSKQTHSCSIQHFNETFLHGQQPNNKAQKRKHMLPSPVLFDAHKLIAFRYRSECKSILSFFDAQVVRPSLAINCWPLLLAVCSFMNFQLFILYLMILFGNFWAEFQSVGLFLVSEIIFG